MIPALLLASTLALGPEHRAAELRTGATNADERVLAVDGQRAITWRAQEGTLRSVPLDDPSKAATIVSGVFSNPVAAPPLIAWTDNARKTHIAPIDAPAAGTLLSGENVTSMKCNATACLAATTLLQSRLLALDGRAYATVLLDGQVLASDPGGFLLTRGSLTARIDNGGALAFATPTPAAASSRGAADFDGHRYTVVYPDSPDLSRPESVLRVFSIGLGGDAGAPSTIASLPRPVLDRVAMAWAGGRHLVVFGYVESSNYLLPQPGVVDRTRLQGLRLDAALQPLDAAPFVVNDTPWADVSPLAIANGSDFLVAWNHSPGPYYSADPEIAGVDADGRAGSRRLLSRGVVSQSVAGIATVAGALLVGYLDQAHEDGAPTLRVRRFTPDGTPFGDSIVAAADDARRAAMAARDGDVLIAWITGTYGVNAAIVHADDSVQPVPLPPVLSGTPSVAASRDGWMLAVGGADSVAVVRIDASGAASAARAIASVGNAFFDAAVASDGERFLAVWSTSAGGITTQCNFQPCGTRATLFDATGGVLASDIRISPVAGLTGATFAGGEYYVATTTGVRLNRDALRVGDVNAYVWRVAPLGNAVLAGFFTSSATQVEVIDHGVAGAATSFGALVPLEIASGGVAYETRIGADTAVVFRAILQDRRRSAYH